MTVPTAPAAAPSPHFVDMGRLRQTWESVGGAVVTGSLAGLFLDLNVWLYIAAVAVSFFGGLPAATQHRTLRGALVRAGVGGLVWGLAVVVVSTLVDREATVPLPNPAIGFLVYALVPPLVAAPIVRRLARGKEPTSHE